MPFLTRTSPAIWLTRRSTAPAAPGQRYARHFRDLVAAGQDAVFASGLVHPTIVRVPEKARGPQLGQRYCRRTSAGHRPGLQAGLPATSTGAGESADGVTGAAEAELIKRGPRTGRTPVRVSPASRTVTCSRCRERQARPRLKLGTFRCARCGSTAGRARNCAVKPRTAERIRSGVDDVSHMPPSSNWLPLPSEPQIPRLRLLGTVKR
jgi:hypothetical protein